jgi:hypothetical protein
VIDTSFRAGCNHCEMQRNWAASNNFGEKRIRKSAAKKTTAHAVLDVG